MEQGKIQKMAMAAILSQKIFKRKCSLTVHCKLLKAILSEKETSLQKTCTRIPATAPTEKQPITTQ